MYVGACTNIYIYIILQYTCEYNAGQVLPHIGHVSGPHGKETFIASRCLAQATLDRWNRKRAVCCALWA